MLMDREGQGALKTRRNMKERMGRSLEKGTMALITLEQSWRC